jgi:hypothetical protein
MSSLGRAGFDRCKGVCTPSSKEESLTALQEDSSTRFHFSARRKNCYAWTQRLGDMARESASNRRFMRALRLASALPWSNADAIYELLTRFLLEHAMMTTVASHVGEFQIDDTSRIKRAVDQTLEVAGEKSHADLTHRTHLVDLYVEGLISSAVPSEGIMPGQRCEWLGGCPAVKREVSGLPPSLARLARMECDHVFPQSRMIRGFAENSYQTLCAYHNQDWKRAHIAFALDSSWFD